MSKDSEQEERELRKEILKQGKVRKPIVTISQKFYPNNRALSLEMKSQELVEIGIDDLMRLILQDRERYALSKQIEENQRWANIYLRTQEELENVGGSGSTTWQSVKQNILDHAERVADLKAQLSKLMDKQ